MAPQAFKDGDRRVDQLKIKVVYGYMPGLSLEEKKRIHEEYCEFLYKTAGEKGLKWTKVNHRDSSRTTARRRG